MLFLSCQIKRPKSSFFYLPPLLFFIFLNLLLIWIGFFFPWKRNQLLDFLPCHDPSFFFFSFFPIHNQQKLNFLFPQKRKKLAFQNLVDQVNSKCKSYFSKWLLNKVSIKWLKNWACIICEGKKKKISFLFGQTAFIFATVNSTGTRKHLLSQSIFLREYI